ncbi:MAG: hypothetical protein ACOY94_23940 [Bacillota bacterium]
MRKLAKRMLMAILFLVLMTSMAAAAISNISGTTIPVEAQAENDPTMTVHFKIYIENFDGGKITKVENSGTHVLIGNVLRPATLAKDASNGFWASRYEKAYDGTHGAVTAAAVNAIHLRVGPEAAYDPLNPYAWTPKLISLGPKEEYDYAGGVYSEALIYTDIPAGSAIFGGWTAPYVGNKLEYYTSSGQWRPVTEYYNGDYTKPAPKRLLITVAKPSTSNGAPDYLEFENWAAGDEVAGVTKATNGRVLVHYPNGTTKHVADVIQRVAGTGRFVGSEYAEVGRVRASHPGVLCLSTSPRVGYTTDSNKRGGFQIVPPNHAKFLSYNLGQDSFIGKPQWMIIAQVGASSSTLYDTRYTIDGKLSFDPAWEAVAPVFGMYIKPKHIPGDTASSTRFEVSTDFGATWQAPPTITGVTDPTTNSPVNGWTNIRLYLQY